MKYNRTYWSNTISLASDEFVRLCQMGGTQVQIDDCLSALKSLVDEAYVDFHSDDKPEEVKEESKPNGKRR